MKFSVRVLIITLLFAMTAQAQSLADLAREERARRTTRTSARKVFNNQTLQALLTPPPVAIDPAANEELIGALGDLQGSLEDLATSGLVESGREVVGAGVDLFRTMIQSLEGMEVATQQEVGRLRAQLANPVMSRAGRAQAQEELDDAERVLGEVRAELADTRAKLADLERGPGGR